MKLIDLEAHFLTRSFQEYVDSIEPLPSQQRHASRYPGGSPHQARLLDLGQGRLDEMDKAGVDMQVISLFTPPHIQMFEPSVAKEWARRTNDDLAVAVKKHPDRFVGLAALPVQSPDDAAEELKRAVTSLGLKGANIASHARNEYLDARKYWIIFETAEKLDVPIYLHPSYPSTSMVAPYAEYRDSLAGAALGFGADAALHIMRLICSGVFDRYPRLKIILGHMGEGLPYSIPRIDRARLGVGSKESFERKPSEYLKTNFTVTTSGMFFEPAFLCCYMTLGAKGITFGVDYPIEDINEATTFIRRIPICDTDKEQVCHGNAEALFKL